MVSSVELRGANIDLGQPDCVTITAKNGSFFSFSPTSDAERKEWVMAIGALMQVFQTHWKAHPIVPVFELLSARITQLWTISKSPTHSEVAERLSDVSMMLIVSYMWNSTRRQERIIERLTIYIQVVKALIIIHCPVDITDALSTVAKQVVQHANLPFPSLQSSLSVTPTADPAQQALSQGRSSPAPTEFKSISFQKSPSKSSINDDTSSDPAAAPSYSQTVTSLNLPTTTTTDGSLLSPISPSSSAGNLTPLASPSMASIASQSASMMASPAAGRRAHVDLASSNSNVAANFSLGLGNGKVSSPPSLSQSSPNLTAKDGDDMKPLTRSYATEVTQEGLKAEAQHHETLQEQVLRSVKDIRATFVKSVEAFKSLNEKNFEKTVAEAEAAFEMLKSSFDELLKPLESPTVVQRLRETPTNYLHSWRRAVNVVKTAFESSDRGVAMSVLRVALPNIGDDMGKASHLLCGSVFEAAQQLFAEQELKGASALFFDCETSRIASFLRQVSAENLRPTSPHTASSTTSTGIWSPFGTPRQDYPNAVHYVPVSTGQTVVGVPPGLQLDEFTDLVRKALLAAQTVTKLCKNSFFDAVSHEDHEKHLSILERLNNVVDKMIADVEGSPESSESEAQNGERTTLLEALISIRDYGDMAASVIETIADLDNDPRAALSTISPQQAIKSLAASRGSQQAFSSKLNSSQMRFSTAAKQLCAELERLLDLVPGAALFDESKLSKEQLKARRKSMAPVAASTHFINHFATDSQLSPRSLGKLESDLTKISIASPAPVSPRSALNAQLSASSPQLPSFTVTDQDSMTTTQSPRSGNHTTWSEKIKPRESITSSDIPRIPTTQLAASGPTASSPLSPSSSSSPMTPTGSASPRGPDSMQWRKSVKSRDDPVSPRTVSFSTSPKADTPLQGGSSPATSPTMSHALMGDTSMTLGAGSLSGIGGDAAQNSSSISSPPSSSGATRSTANKSNVPMQALTVRGVTIYYPLTENIWIEPEEGNLRYLKASELENTAASSSATGERSSGVTSPTHSRAAAASKAQSTRDLGRPSLSPTTSSPLHSSTRSGHSAVKSDVPSQSPGSHKSHVKSESETGAASTAKPSSSATLSQSVSGSPGSGRALIADPLLASATLNRLIIKLTSESAVDVAFMKSFLATYRSFTTPEELWGKLLERYNVPPNSDFSDETYKQQVILPIHLRVANVIGMWLALNYMDISETLMVHIEHFVDSTVATGEAKGLQRKLKSAVEKSQSDKRLRETLENSKYSRVRAGGAERAKAFKQVMMTARNARLDPFLFFNEDDIDPQLIAEQLTALDWSLFSKITNSELLNAHLMSKGTFNT